MKEVAENKERDRAAARQLAERYRYEFVELKGIHLDLELFRTIQVDLMFRYNVVPLRTDLSDTVDRVRDVVGRRLVSEGLVAPGAVVVFISVDADLTRGDANYLKIQRV